MKKGLGTSYNNIICCPLPSICAHILSQEATNRLYEETTGVTRIITRNFEYKTVSRTVRTKTKSIFENIKLHIDFIYADLIIKRLNLVTTR